MGGGLAARRSPPLGVVGCPTDGLDRVVDRVVDGDPRHIGAEAAQADQDDGFVRSGSTGPGGRRDQGLRRCDAGGHQDDEQDVDVGAVQEGRDDAGKVLRRGSSSQVDRVAGTGRAGHESVESGAELVRQLRDDEPLSVRSVGGKDAEATGVADDGDPSADRQRLLGQEERGPAHRLGARTRYDAGLGEEGVDADRR